MNIFSGFFGEMASSGHETSGTPTYMQVMDLIHKSEDMRSKEDIDGAKIYLSNAQEMNKKLGDQYLEALILEGFGFCYRLSGDYEKAFKMANNAISIFENLPGLQGEFGNANGLLSLGSIYRELGRYKETIACQEKAIEILVRLTNNPNVKSSRQGLTYEKHLAGAYGNMGETLSDMGEYERGLKLSQEARKINQKMGDKLAEAVDLHNMGKAYNGLERFAKAIECCKGSARMLKALDNIQSASKSYAILALCYMTLNELETSDRYHEMCININVHMKQFDVLAMVYGNRGMLYYKIGLAKFFSFGDAKESFESSVENFKLAIESTDKVLASISEDDNRTAFSDRFYRWYDQLTAPFNLLGRSAAALLFLDLGRAKILRQLVYNRVNYQLRKQ